MITVGAALSTWPSIPIRISDFAHGYSGHGVALTGLAGRIVAEAILGNNERLAIFSKLKVPSVFGGKLVKNLALKIGVNYYRFLDKYR